LSITEGATVPALIEAAKQDPDGQAEQLEFSLCPRVDEIVEIFEHKQR
jgi:hypothetical protein